MLRDDKAKEITEFVQKEDETSHLFNVSHVPRTWHYYLIFITIPFGGYDCFHDLDEEIKV